jgi:hypothetical protein
MKKAFRKSRRVAAVGLCAAALALTGGLTAPSGARAGEAEAKSLLKAMSNYLAAQKIFAFEYDSNFEVVTKDHQKLMLATSGAIELSRPDKIRLSRAAGFANVEMVFDGNMLTILDRDGKIFVQVDVPGPVDHLIDELRDKFAKPLPGADLLLPDVYDVLMDGVTDVKDLGSGVIGGRECDHLAFRAKEVDWQIWIAQGDRPFPCRYIITSTQVDQAPQYSIEIRDWKSGAEVTARDFSFKAPPDARRIDTKELKDMKAAGELPGNFSIGGKQ